MCEMDSSSLWDVALAMASGSSRGKGSTSLNNTDGIRNRQPHSTNSKVINILPADTVKGNHSWEVWETEA